MRSTYSKSRRRSPFESNAGLDKSLYAVWYQDLSEADKAAYAAVPEPDWAKFGSNRWEVYKEAGPDGKEIIYTDGVLAIAFDSYARHWLRTEEAQLKDAGSYVHRVLTMSTGQVQIVGVGVTGEPIAVCAGSQLEAVNRFVQKFVEQQERQRPDDSPPPAAA